MDGPLQKLISDREQEDKTKAIETGIILSIVDIKNNV